MHISSITATVTISRSKSHCKPLAFRAIGFIGLVLPVNILLMGHIKVAQEHHVVPYPIVRLTLKEMLVSRTETAHFKLWPR